MAVYGEIGRRMFAGVKEVSAEIGERLDGCFGLVQWKLSEVSSSRWNYAESYKALVENVII